MHKRNRHWRLLIPPQEMDRLSTWNTWSRKENPFEDWNLGRGWDSYMQRLKISMIGMYFVMLIICNLIYICSWWAEVTVHITLMWDLNNLIPGNLLQCSPTHLQQFSSPLLGRSADHDLLNISSPFTVSTLTRTSQAHRSNMIWIIPEFKQRRAMPVWIMWAMWKGTLIQRRQVGAGPQGQEKKSLTRMLEGKTSPRLLTMKDTHAQTEQKWLKTLVLNNKLRSQNSKDNSADFHFGWLLKTVRKIFRLGLIIW